MMRLVAAGLCTVVAFILVVGRGTSQDKDKEKPKFTIKEVMKAAHDKEGLLGKVLKGEASAEEKTKLVELYVALCQNTPPQGEDTAWKERCLKIVVAARGIAKGDDQAPRQLQAVTNCRTCHTAFKKPKA
jgi:hypothetical protein